MFGFFGHHTKKTIRPLPPVRKVGGDRSTPPASHQPDMAGPSVQGTRAADGHTPARTEAARVKLTMLAGLVADRLQPLFEDHARQMTDRTVEVMLQNQAQTDGQITAVAQEIREQTLGRLSDETRGLQQVVEGQLAALSDRLHRQAEADMAARFAALAAQLQEICSDASRRSTLRPVIDLLLALLDRIDDERAFMAAWYRRDPQLTLHLGAREMFERYDAAVQSFSVEIYMLLRTLDVRPINGGAGRFDPRHQKVVAVEPTTNPDLDGHVARIVRAGFTWGSTVLRPESVVVFKKE